MSAWNSLAWAGAARTLRAPTLWLWGAGLAAAWPLALALTPLGTTTKGSSGSGLASEVAYLSILVGVSFGLLQLPRLGWLLAPQTPARRTGLQAAALVGYALPLVLAGVLPGAFLVQDGSAALELGLRSALALAHLVALALALMQLSIEAWVRAACLPALSWLLPALLGSASGTGAGLLWLLGCPSLQIPPSESVSGGALWKGEMGPIIGLTLAALLLAERRSPYSNALRHSG